jgi:hypothetical protein
MKFSGVLSFFKYYWQFVPFKINFILFITLLAVGNRWLILLKTDTSSYIGLVLLMAKIVVFFATFLVILSFCSAFFCWFYFLIKKDKYTQKALDIQLDKSSLENNVLKISTQLPFTLKPLLGFVKVKLIYDGTLLTEKFIIKNRLKKQFIPFNTGLSSINELNLPDIKAYHFSKAIIYFEDMLQFFSFAIPQNIHQTINNLPYTIATQTNSLSPKKTEDQQIKIEQLRRVDGEYLNYKKFEDSDDVRRIVWKIFAKNKELVVRVPEIMDPFASHIYMYASFFNHTDFNLLPHFQQEMLNRFKRCVWSIYDEISKKEFEVKFIFDQFLQSENNTVQNNITLSNWHQDKILIDYFKPQYGSILCIHSLSSISDIKQLISAIDNQTIIYFIQLSKQFKSNYILNIILRIFIKPTNDRLSNLKSKWAIHPFKFKTLHNEQKIIELLKKQGVNFEII